MFHRTFGYYARGVVESTAILPKGWEDRLVRFHTPGTGGVTAACLEVHDLWISKAIAGRPKDLEFCEAVLLLDEVDPATLLERLDEVPDLDDRLRAAAEGRIPK